MSSLVRQEIENFRDLSSKTLKKKKELERIFKAYLLALDDVAQKENIKVNFPHPDWKYSAEVTLYNGEVTYSNKYEIVHKESIEKFFKKLYPGIIGMTRTLQYIENTPVGKQITPELVQKYLKQLSS